MLPDDYYPPAEQKPLGAAGYAYTLPSDYMMSDAHRKKLDVLVDDLLLSNNDAQRLIDFHVELTEDFVERWLNANSTVLRARLLAFIVCVVACTITINVLVTILIVRL